MSGGPSQLYHIDLALTRGESCNKDKRGKKTALSSSELVTNKYISPSSEGDNWLTFSAYH